MAIKNYIDEYTNLGERSRKCLKDINSYLAAQGYPLSQLPTLIQIFALILKDPTDPFAVKLLNAKNNSFLESAGKYRELYETLLQS